MNDDARSKLSAAGRLRRQAILDDVLAASVRRQVRRRRVRLSLAAAAVFVLAAGVPWWLSSGDREHLVELPPPGDDVRESESDPAPRHLIHESPAIIVETLTDEMLLAQLDAAKLPYLQTADGAIRLAGTGGDPWDFSDERGEEL